MLEVKLLIAYSRKSRQKLSFGLAFEQNVSLHFTNALRSAIVSSEPSSPTELKRWIKPETLSRQQLSQELYVHMI